MVNGSLKKVKALWKARVFGDDRIIKVRVGELVDGGSVLAEVIKRDEVLVVADGLLDKMKQSLVGRVVGMGEVIYRNGGWGGGVSIISPIDGTITVVDEFNNIHIEGKSSWKNLVVAPVDSKVIAISEEGIELEFVAWEVKGESIGEGVVWGNWDGRVAGSARELDYKCRQAVVVASMVDGVLVAKAEALEVVGIVAGEVEKELLGSIPILTVGNAIISEVKSKAERGGETKILVDCSAGRILVVVQ